MREEFLYHLWKFQKFNTEALKTSEGQPLQIFHPGVQNELSGPDFFNARIQIDNQVWAGNVEIHINSSHWYSHHHETDLNYDNVILHVVWEQDAEIYRKDNSIIPVLELKGLISEDILEIYQNLLEVKHHTLNCERDFGGFSDFQIQHWLERLFFERLEKKSALILDILKQTGNNWEATLFIMLTRSLGSKVNAEAFTGMARSFDFKVVQKLGKNQSSLEALFLGQAKLIRDIDQYGISLQKEYDYLKHKFSLENEYLQSPQFFRLRPDNFPTIRLAQLASLYSERKNLFYEVIRSNNLKELQGLFNVNISHYWKNHYNFGKDHPQKDKKLSSEFLNLILINCIIPIKHCYAQFVGEDSEQTLQDLINEIKAEKNSVIDLFIKLRPDMVTTAMHSQALLQLKTEYCDLNKCLQCELGASLLRKSPKYI